MNQNKSATCGQNAAAQTNTERAVLAHEDGDGDDYHLSLPALQRSRQAARALFDAGLIEPGELMRLADTAELITGRAGVSAPASGLMTYTVTCAVCHEECSGTWNVRRGDALPVFNGGCRYVEEIGNVCPKHTVTVLVDGKAWPAA